MTQPINVEDFLNYPNYQLKLCFYQDPANRVKPTHPLVYEQHREEARVFVW